MHRIVPILILLSFLSISLAVPMPVGIAGKITVNGEPIPLNVTVENLNTGKNRTVTTNNGYYACALSGSDGDRIKITIIYNGSTYSNYTYVNTSRATQWLNLSISITNSGGGGETGSSSPPHQPPPPSPPSSFPPIADFTFIPTHPNVNESVAFISISSDPDDDIVNYTWQIEGKTFYGQMHEHIFHVAGDYLITLVVMDSDNHIAVTQKTITVAPIPTQENINEENNTNIHSNQTNETQSNITISILIKDKNNNTLPNTPVYIYDENNTLILRAYTNETGVAQVTVPQGSYYIKAQRGEQTQSKHMQFVNDGRVTFLFSGEPTEDRTETFNWLLVIPIAVIVIFSVTIIYIKLRRPWWK